MYNNMSENINTTPCRLNTYDVYVGRVPRSVQQGVLFQLFSHFGTVLEVMLREGPKTGPYGFAIIKFLMKEAADKALRAKTVRLNGQHELEVKNAMKKGSQNAENCNGTTSYVKTVHFAEPKSSMQQAENVSFMEPSSSYRDCGAGFYSMSETMNGVYGSYPKDENANVGHYSESGIKNRGPFPPTESVNFNMAPALNMAEIICTSVDNAATFYGVPIQDLQALQDHSFKVDSICKTLNRRSNRPSLKKIYGALYKEDNRWYRCKVLQCSHSSTCLVEYIDYGNKAEVSYTDMVDLPKPFQLIPPYARKCVFSSLQPTPKPGSNISYLHHLVNERMSLCAFATSGGSEFQVSKCSCNGIDIIAELVRNGNAKHRHHESRKFSTNLDKSACTIPQRNHKQKLTNGSHAVNKVSNSCNDVDKNSNEVKKEDSDGDNTKSPLSPESYCSEIFVPKRIIKRGSVTNHSLLDANKSIQDALKVDSVISNLKLVNNIRNMVPLHANDDLINEAIDLLKNESDQARISSNDLKISVETAHKKFIESLKDLKNCSEKEELQYLKQERDIKKMELCNELKKYFDTFDCTLLEKRKKIQKIITDLESNSTAWLNVYLPEVPDSIEDLIIAFNEEKEKKKNIIEIARRNTNEKHAKLINVLAELQKELALNMLDGKTSDSNLPCTGGKRGSWALKLLESLSVLDDILEEERITSTQIKVKTTHMSVIQCILEKLDIPKEKIDAECEVYEKYKALNENLLFSSNLESLLDEMCSLHETIQVESLNKELTDSVKLFEFQSALLREDALMANLAEAAVGYFPELVLEQPELPLEEYLNYSGMLKFSWDIDFFPFFEKCSRVETSYISKLVDEPVVIKKFDMNCDSDLQKAVTWNEIKSDSLVKLKGLFKDKDKSTVYAVLPPVWDTLYNKPLTVPVDNSAALALLQQVLSGLCDIHSRGIVHGALHPMSVLHNGGKVMLDFNLDKQYLQDKLCLKGINFEVPNGEDLCKSADMYSFGCLILWVLFPNLSFHSTNEGVPDISAFQSIIRDLLMEKDFTYLSSLLSVNKDIRPSSRVLRNNHFLKNLRIMSEAATS